MTLEELEKEWASDCTLNEADIIGETKKIPLMHSKYYKLYIRSAMKVKKLKFDLLELQKLKHEYYSGSLAKEDLDKHGWKQNQLRIMKSDIPKHIESDKDIIELSMKIGFQSEMLKFLEEIIKQINGRNFLVKNIIDYLKFTNGVT